MANEYTSIWFQDPTVLFKKDQLNQLWPKEGMSRDQKINAITRLVIILTVLGYLLTQSLNFFITGAITLGVIMFLYYAKTLKEGDNKKEVKEAFTNPSVYNSVKSNFTNPTDGGVYNFHYVNSTAGEVTFPASFLREDGTALGTLSVDPARIVTFYHYQGVNYTMEQ